MKIFKYLLRIVDLQIVEMPGPLNLLHVGEQRGFLYLWAVVCEEAPLEKVPIRIVGTGDSFDDYLDWTFVRTAQMKSGLVWHVFSQDPNRKEGKR
jgi:hypothetical protein